MNTKERCFGCRLGSGSIVSNAGSSVIVTKKAAITPKGSRIPMFAIGAISAEMNESMAPAVVKLVALIRRTLPAAKHKPVAAPLREAGAAVAGLANLKDYDFHVISRCTGGAHVRYRIIEPRSDHYRAELARLLKWWEQTGSKLDWDPPPEPE